MLNSKNLSFSLIIDLKHQIIPNFRTVEEVALYIYSTFRPVCIRDYPSHTVV